MRRPRHERCIAELRFALARSRASVGRREEQVMATMARELGDEAPAETRVEDFLECIETKRRRSARFRIAAAAVGALVATVVYLTSIGVVPPDAARLAASAGTLVAGVLASEPTSAR